MTLAHTIIILAHLNSTEKMHRLYCPKLFSGAFIGDNCSSLVGLGLKEGDIGVSIVNYSLFGKYVGDYIYVCMCPKLSLY